MKILHVINSLATGGAEKLLVETLPLYAQEGIVADIAILNGIEHPLLKKIKEMKYCKMFAFGNGSVYNPKFIFTLIPFFKKYDIIHVHLFPAKYYVAVAKIFSRAKIPLVFTEHCTTNRRIENYFTRFIDKQIIKCYDYTICITSEIREIVAGYTKLPENRFPIIENGINLKIFQSASACERQSINSSLSASDFLLIQVAAFREQKDQETLIKAMLLLPVHFKLLLVGEGVEKEKCEMLVKKLKLESRIFFLGVRMNIPQLLKMSDVVVLSSKYEGLSLSSIEGMASGKPFVASNVPGLKDVVEGAGILFPFGDDKKLAEEIKHLSQDQNYYRKISEQCLERAKNYDITEMVEKHIALYKKVIE